jgi:serine/threonine protein kinase
MVSEFRNEEAIFDAALGFDSEQERAEYLQRACGDDSILLHRLEALLKVHRSEQSFLEQAANSLQLTLESPMAMEGPGTTIDRYKLLEKIGEGGMAVVYMAEQQRPVRRRVALKIIKLGMDTKQVIARFEAERQALALMDHPNIAHVFDGGATETGRPYFVMELVRGVAINEYCDKNRLSTRERLELFNQVCNAVQHAHQKGIIHRDIKPSNVMVTLHDGKPVPKVIDFGIAKATNQRLTEQTLFTRYAQMIGTPEYMSPEQAEMSGLDVDTRTDIYSLGVLLYELLTGSTPFAGETLRGAGYAEMQRIIRETDPLKPSTKIRTLGQTLTEVALCRHTSPEILRKLVKGDLDWIAMKAMEKDRTHRYETAHALAEDIERHLHHEPIRAGSPSTVYRIQKFVRRHRTRLITGSAIVVIVLGLLVTSIAYTRFSIQRTRANHERTLAMVEDRLAVGEYQHALSEVKPILSSRFVGPRARLLNARVLLELQGPDAGIKQLQDLLQERPEIAANAHFLLAAIYLESDPSDPRMKSKADIHLQQGERLLPQTAEAFLLRAMTAQTVRDTLDWLNKAVSLDPAHYGTRKARAAAYYAMGEYRNMETEASVMIGSQAKNPAGYAFRGIARRQMALKQNDSELLREALADQDQAVALMGARDQRLAELFRQRCETFLCMGLYEQALGDTQACLELQPNDVIHSFRLFCLLTALGEYEKAQARHDGILESHAMEEAAIDRLAARYVFDSLSAGRPWHPAGRIPVGKAFAAMQQAAEEYRQLAARGTRVVPEGFHPSWSPDQAELAYSRGVLGASGIEILNLKTGKTRLLTIPGKDPTFSPDGKYIAYVRDRQVLSLQDLAMKSQGEHPPMEQEEIWIVKADGTEAPRLLASGGWPNWGRSSNRLYYHSRVDMKMYSVSIDPANNDLREILSCKYQFPVVSPDEKCVAFMQDDMTTGIKDLATQSITVWPGPLIKQHMFLSWSTDGRQLAAGGYWGAGLWIYDVEKEEASKVMDGFFGCCSWSQQDGTRMAVERPYAQWHHEIWVIDLDSQVPAATPGTQANPSM